MTNQQKFEILLPRYLAAYEKANDKKFEGDITYDGYVRPFTVRLYKFEHMTEVLEKRGSGVDVIKKELKLNACTSENCLDKHSRLKKELYEVELEMAKWLRDNKDQIDFSDFGGGNLVEVYKYGINNLKKPPHEIDHESKMPTYGKAG